MARADFRAAVLGIRRFADGNRLRLKILLVE
jgi:hypothetical protein